MSCVTGQHGLLFQWHSRGIVWYLQLMKRSWLFHVLKEILAEDTDRNINLMQTQFVKCPSMEILHLPWPTSQKKPSLSWIMEMYCHRSSAFVHKLEEWFMAPQAPIIIYSCWQKVPEYTHHNLRVISTIPFLAKLLSILLPSPIAAHKDGHHPNLLSPPQYLFHTLF